MRASEQAGRAARKRRHVRKALASAVAFASLAFVVAAPAASELNQSEPDPSSPTLSTEEALLDDAEEYAKLHGVSIDEALRRLDLQLNVIPEFENAVSAGEASRYGGLVIENEPNYRVVVFLTSGDVPDLERYVSDDRLRGLVEVRRVARTYNQLRSAQMRALRLRSADFDSDIDIPSNQVRLYVAATQAAEVAAKAEALRAEAARSGPVMPNWVLVKGKPSLARPALDVFGGLFLTGPPNCTSGFSVTGPGGSGGVTTAGHCDAFTYSYAGYPLFFKESYFGLNFDIRWDSRPNTNFPAKIYRGQGVYGAITGKKARWNQPIGATICKRGITTDRTCGTILTKDVAPSYVPSSSPTFIGTTAQMAGGDSGGPVFVGGEAWGTASGFTSDGWMIYMASNYIESSFNLYIKGT